jgi:transcriptional regulator with GAF, ATPase, and Fis domain
VNCAALPDTLIESELFGHEKGSFTGAAGLRKGRFELADGGTIFLDEIGDLPPGLQAKLLRVLQSGEFERLGSEKTLKADVRVITATNRNLEAAAADGSFRPDLYYRLKVFPIKVPPLRDRREDIPLLVWHFITTRQATLGRRVETIPRRAMERLVAYDWPGNVRELEHVIERALILSPGSTLMVEELVSVPGAAAPLNAGGSQQMADAERAHILRVLRDCGWKVKGNGNAAERLGLNPSTLRSRMKKLGIERPTRG